MSANFLYTLWNLCFIQVGNVFEALISYNILDKNANMGAGVQMGSIHTTPAYNMYHLYNNYFVPLGLALLISVVLLILIQKIVFEGLTKEIGIKVGVGFMISVGLIINGFKLAEHTIGFTNGIASKLYSASEVRMQQDQYDSYQMKNSIKAIMQGKESTAKITESENFKSFKSFVRGIDPSIDMEIKGISFDELEDLKKSIYEETKSGKSLDEAIEANESKIKSNAKYNIVLVDENGDELHFFDAIKTGFTSLLILAVVLLIFALANFASLTISSVVIITRMVELGLRAIGIPIAGLEVALNGYSSNSTRYLKGFLATAIQGVLIVLILWLRTIMTTVLVGIFAKQTSGIEGGIPFMIMTIATVFTFTGLLVKSQQLGREIVGV